jgi:BlaI family transcriptional regulator, penicillinase repressor
MAEPKLTKLELRIMDTLWTNGHASIRELQEAFPEKTRPAYTTVQTTVYRLEAKNAVKRVKKVGNFHIFEAAVSRSAAQRTLIDDLLALFGGRTQPVMAHLIESGKLTLADMKEAEELLRKLGKNDGDGLARQLGQPVINKTDLTGRYDFHLHWTKDAARPESTDASAHSVSDDSPSLLTAVQEQLGLKLEQQTGPTPVLVIDHIEQPASDQANNAAPAR